MSTKTYFKRISLAVILALSFGAFSSAPSQALVSGSGAVSLSASTDSRVAQETSTVTVTASFTATAAGESLTVKVEGTGATGSAGTLTASLSDSLNIRAGGTAPNAAPTTATTGLIYAATAANVFTRVKVNFVVPQVTVAGTHVYTVNVFADAAIVATTTYTITVALANTDATAGQSQLFLNESLPTSSTYILADSSLVVSAGQTPTLSLMTPAKVAYLGVNFKNSAGESVVSTTGTSVSGTMTVKITQGPGLISKVDSTKVRELTVTLGDTITIWNDGASGVTTITGYIGVTPLTQTAKTITFYGKATTCTATANAVTARG